MKSAHRWSFGVFAILILVGACIVPQGSVGKSMEIASAEFLPGSLVETEELASLLGKPNVVIVDARDEDPYKQFHLPNAVNIPRALFRTPEDLAYKAEHGFAISQEKAEKVFEEAEIDANTRVVVYDSTTFPLASIIWTLLKYYGHDNVQVLRGGYEKWASEGRPVTTEMPKVEKRVFKANPRPEMIASKEYILKNQNREDFVVLDMRSFGEYLGIDIPAGHKRGGHVTNAVNIEWLELAGSSTVKSAGGIQSILQEAGITKDKEIVTLCNWGIGRATFGFMVLKMLGYENVRVYGGSMEDWQSDTSAEMSDVSKVPTTIK